MVTEVRDSAGPALRGFRLQILYTLARLTEPRTALQATLWPEGIEDLAVFDHEGLLREAIQIKGHTAPLTLSELMSKRGKGLLKRSVSIARQHPECRIRLLSFGPIGQELLDAWSGTTRPQERVASKLKRAGFTVEDVALLFARLVLELVDEGAERAKVDRFLASAPTLAGESSHAASILCHWLYGAAERRERIAQSDLIARLADVGRYLHARAGYWRDWHSVVKPLDQLADLELQRDRLGAQFQQGMSVRYEHILAGCDIPRRRWLDEISAGFAKESVVIVHGASGQGKSALAYRWLHDETPDLWRYEIKLVDTRRDALQIAGTLAGHARAVGAPMTYYIDVHPGDTAWPELVQELARLPQIRVLITIREEDWRRATLSGATVAFEEIELSLSEPEAREIYLLLDRADDYARFLSFEDAWRRFVGSAGNEGPLMEFVYLVTRTETLRERLKSQVAAIRDAALEGRASAAELRVLALVAFASAHGARLDVAALRRDLVEVDLGRIVERLEREYLVRTLGEGLLLDGLHQVRSRLLTDILCDGMTFDAQELAPTCLGLIFTDDTEVFLLHLATRQAELMPAIIRHFDKWQPPTWAGIGGVLRALLWWGVRQYVEQIAGLAAEIRSLFGKGWWVILDLDLAGLLPESGTAIWKQLDILSEDKKRRFQSYLDRQPQKALALAPARNWLCSLTTCPMAPASQSDWAAVAELCFWSGHWRIDASISQWLRAVVLDAALDELSLRQLAELIRGRWELEGEQLRPWLARHRDYITTRFRTETNTAWIDHRNGTFRAHFFVSWGDFVEADKTQPVQGKKRKDRLHTEAMWRVDLLRGLFPDGVGYGCQGYGHQVLPMPYDSTLKTSIKPEGLPPPWAVRVNAFASALVEWRHRPAEWENYVSQIWTLREAMHAVMRDLRRALTAHFRDRRKRQALGKRLDSDTWNSLKRALTQGITLPQQAVDEWGFVSEGKESNDESGDPRFEQAEQRSIARFNQGFALATFQPYLKAQLDLFSGLDNFLGQAAAHLYLHCADGEAGVELSRRVIEAKLQESDEKTARPALTTLNLANAVSALPRFQREFRQLFSGRVTAERLNEQDRIERKAFETVLPLWIAYLAQPTAHFSQPEQRVRAMLQGPVDRMPQHFEHALRALEPEGVRTRILKHLDTWESAPAIWVVLDSDNPVHSLTAAALAKPILQQAVLDAKLDDEQTRALQRRWSNVVILACVGGRSLDRQVWLLPIFRLTASSLSSEFEWLDELPHLVSDEEWARTRIHCWDVAELAAAKDLLRSIGRFKVLADHLSGWLTLAQREEADRDVLQGYIDRHQDEWSGILEELVDALGELDTRYNSLSVEEHAQRPYLTEAAQTISEHFSDWLPPGLDRGEAVMSVDVCMGWLDTVTQSMDALLSVGAAVLIDQLEQAAARSNFEALPHAITRMPNTSHDGD